ncbi:hypothetical protein BKA57DRAFT_518051 [Linnemannia elongata]|nr:hypothetical protein BKA57DRAFT_518051 [Linnemannia elongata]
MVSSRPVRVGSASHTSKKNDQVNARETHIYRTTEEITVARVYEENESGYAGIEGTFLDGFNAEQVIHAILPEKFVQANSNFYEIHQRLTELYLEERFKGTIILCSGTMTMTLLASGPRIKKYFAMENGNLHMAFNLVLPHGHRSKTQHELAILQASSTAFGQSQQHLPVQSRRPPPCKDANRLTMTSLQGSLDLDVPLARRRATLAKPQSPLKATAP